MTGWPVQANKYLSVLRRAATEPSRIKEALFGGGTGGAIGVAMGSVAASAFAVAAASTGLGAVLDATKVRRDATREQAGSSFWFLHEAHVRLGE